MEELICKLCNLCNYDPTFLMESMLLNKYLPTFPKKAVDVSDKLLQYPAPPNKHPYMIQIPIS